MTAEPPTYATILASCTDGIATITFNRPEVRNALNLAMVEDIRAAVARFAADDTVRAVIFTGAGEKAFLGGADIAELRDRKRADAFKKINNALFRQIESMPMPTIAAVRGFALGGGCEIAMACDLRVAGEGAKFGQPEVGLGIIAGAGGCHRLARLVGVGRARELLYTGRIIGSAEAERIGLVNRVVADTEVVSGAEALAKEIAANSNLAVRLTKQIVNISHEASIDALTGFEATAQAVLFEDPEKVARMTAFLEKRKKK